MIKCSNLIPDLPAVKSQTTSSWKIYRSTSTEFKSKQSFQSPSLPVEVHQLVAKLAKVEGVARVRAVAPRAIDIHWIEFELELHPEIELDDETWDNIEDLVIDCEWDLRDQTNEKWYFQRKSIEKFTKIQKGAKIVAQSDISYSSYPRYYKSVKSSSDFSDSILSRFVLGFDSSTQSTFYNPK